MKKLYRYLRTGILEQDEMTFDGGVHMFQKRKIGFWFLVAIGLHLNFLFLIGQTGAIINYDFTVSLGLQESKNEITEIGVAFNN